ncbi:MAG: YbaB/EbfC family nucleoid-associated protein [Gordonia amarae]
MLPPNIEEFGRKVQLAQLEIERIRARATRGRVTVEVDAAGQLIAVNTPDEDAILAAYIEARSEIDERVKIAAQEVLDDPVAHSISSLVNANKATRSTTRTNGEDASELGWEEMRRNPLGRRHKRW